MVAGEDDRMVVGRSDRKDQNQHHHSPSSSSFYRAPPPLTTMVTITIFTASVASRSFKILSDLLKIFRLGGVDGSGGASLVVVLFHR
ncbi:hypothetical protein HanIR_Chr09g0392431 [Helianthus annuus]|nr:hypothetical protein HanIR_Chr09g0392431 [Helianthus annuus]